MSRKPISFTNLSETLNLAECHDGWWLWDDTRGMNLSMKAKTSEVAFVEALTYYQRRLKEVEKELATLNAHVELFVKAVRPIEEDWYT